MLKGTGVWRFSKSILSPTLLSSFSVPPWLYRVNDRSPCHHSLHYRVALQHCDEAGGPQLGYSYSFPSSPNALVLFPSTIPSAPIILSQYQSREVEEKYLQVNGQFGVENIYRSLSAIFFKMLSTKIQTF